MSAEELRKAATTLRGQAGPVTPDLGDALADVLDSHASAFEQIGFPSPEHEGAFPIVALARLINGGAS